MQRLLMAALGIGVLLGLAFYELQGPPDEVATASVVSAPAAADEGGAPGAPPPGTGGSGAQR